MISYWFIGIKAKAFNGSLVRRIEAQVLVELKMLCTLSYPALVYLVYSWKRILMKERLNSLAPFSLFILPSASLKARFLLHHQVYMSASTVFSLPPSLAKRAQSCTPFFPTLSPPSSSHTVARPTPCFFFSAETMTSTYAASRTDSVLYILTFMSEKDYEDYQFEYRSRLVRCALSSLFRPDTSRIRWKRIFTFQVYFVDDYL